MLGELRESFTEETLLELRPEQLVGLQNTLGQGWGVGRESKAKLGHVGGAGI